MRSFIFFISIFSIFQNITAEFEIEIGNIFVLYFSIYGPLNKCNFIFKYAKFMIHSEAFSKIENVSSLLFRKPVKVIMKVIL